MENGNKPAFDYSVAISTSEMERMHGLTKREYFAGLAMQGLCAGRSEYESIGCSVRYAVELADLLLKELEK